MEILEAGPQHGLISTLVEIHLFHGLVLKLDGIGLNIFSVSQIVIVGFFYLILLSETAVTKFELQVPRLLIRRITNSGFHMFEFVVRLGRAAREHKGMIAALRALVLDWNEW